MEAVNKMCLLERILRSNGFILVHDGQQNTEGAQLIDDGVSFFIRKYRLKMDGEFVNTWIKFIYDDRSQYVDFEIYSKDKETRGREKMVLGKESLKVEAKDE